MWDWWGKTANTQPGEQQELRVLVQRSTWCPKKKKHTQQEKYQRVSAQECSRYELSWKCLWPTNKSRIQEQGVRERSTRTRAKLRPQPGVLDSLSKQPLKLKGTGAETLRPRYRSELAGQQGDLTAQSKSWPRIHSPPWWQVRLVTKHKSEVQVIQFR